MKPFHKDSLGYLYPEAIRIAGVFFPDTAGAPTYGPTGHRGWTVERTSTGLFTVRLLTLYTGLLAHDCSLRLAAIDDKFVQFGAINLVTKTVLIRVFDVSAAAVADVAADANNAIAFSLDLLTSQGALGAT